MEVSISEKVICDSILKFIEEKSDVRTSQFDDLLAATGLAGYDCDIFIEDFSRFFNVDFSTFDSSKYYLDDGVSIFRVIYWRLFRKEMLPRFEISLDHLCDVVKRKMWFDPPLS